MSRDFNNPIYPIIEDPDEVKDSETHLESPDESFKSNVKTYEHPLFSGNGVIQLINTAIKFSNTQEEELKGKIEFKVIKDIADAALQSRVPYDLLLHAADWKERLTERKDAKDVKEIAQNFIQYAQELRGSLGRDPLIGEMFMAHAFKGASKVKEVFENHLKKPDEIVKSLGTDKDDIVINKKRGQKTQPRTNREVYDYFRRRIGSGAVLFKQNLGKDPYKK